MKIGAAVTAGRRGGNATAITRNLTQAQPRNGILGKRLVAARRATRVHAPPGRDALIERECARNALTWAALTRLGVTDGAELALDFFYETAGPEADRTLAGFLRRDAGYDVVIEQDGVTGRTPPLPVGPAALDEWVETMLHLGYEHGGCAFAGWTATITRPASTST